MATAAVATKQDLAQDFRKLAMQTVSTAATTLAGYGIDHNKFAEIVFDAVLTNPKVLECTRESASKALRECCRDGLVPNGREAFINTYYSREKGGRIASYQPMKEGLARLAHEAAKLEIHTGCVHEKDVIEELIQGAGVYQMIKVKTDPFRDRGETIGVWLWCILPGQEFPRLITWNKKEIDARKDASHTKNPEEAAWKWYDEMAQTKIQKHFLNAHRHLFAAGSKGAQLRAVLDNEVRRELELEAVEAMVAIPEHVDTGTGEVIEATATAVQEQPPGAETPPPADDIPEPAAQPAAPATQEAAPAAAQKTTTAAPAAAPKTEPAPASPPAATPAVTTDQPTFLPPQEGSSATDL